MSCFTFVSVIFFLLCFDSVATYKVLVYAPKMGHSHVVFMGKIADCLLDAGHEVVMYVPALDPSVKTNGTNRAHVIQFDAMNGLDLHTNSSLKKDPFDESFTVMENDTMNLFLTLSEIYCKNQIKNKELIQNTLGKHKFDIAFTEVYDYCSFGIFKLLNIPTYIVTSAMPLPQVIDNILGVSHPLSYVPNIWSSSSDEMTYFERATNILVSRHWTKFYKSTLAMQNALFREFHGADFPSLDDLAKKTAFAFINADEFIEFARPITHKIIYIGGISIPKTKPLSKGVEAIIEKAKKGVILLSFGSFANSTFMPLPKKVAILNAFANFPDYQFIWKYEQPEQDRELFKDYSNVYLMKWIPQVDLLNHPKVKAFITHGGLNSITEAIYSGTPTVAVPLFGDQEHNVAAAVKRGVTVFLGKNNLNTDSLINAIGEVLRNDTYEKNAKRISAMIAKKPMKPAELIVKWTEFAAEFQDLSNLDIAGRDFSLIKYYCLDIFVSIILLAVIALLTAVKFIQFLLKKGCAMLTAKQKIQ